MSIIIALISDRYGLVASDGRRFAPAEVTSCGTVTKEADVERDDFDKTFEVAGRPVIGAVAGLLEFSNRTVADHIDAIVRCDCAGATSLRNVADAVAQGLTAQLAAIAQDEVLFAHRTIDLLLAGRRMLSYSNFQIRCLHFYPEVCAHEIICRKSTVTCGRRNQMAVRGDPLARSAAVARLGSRDATKRDQRSLEYVAGDAIRCAVAASGIHPYGSKRTCGGGPFVRTLPS